MGILQEVVGLLELLIIALLIVVPVLLALQITHLLLVGRGLLVMPQQLPQRQRAAQVPNLFGCVCLSSHLMVVGEVQIQIFVAVA